MVIFTMEFQKRAVIDPLQAVRQHQFGEVVILKRPGMNPGDSAVGGEGYEVRPLLLNTSAICR
jgi:hypothetical protein